MPADLLYLALIEENSLFEDEFKFLRVKEWSIEDFLVSWTWLLIRMREEIYFGYQYYLSQKGMDFLLSYF